MRNRVLKGLTLVLLIFTLAGCATNLYVWNDYSKKKYKHVKDNTMDATYAYKNSLLGVISSSRSAGKQVPPGIYCELGQLFSKEGKQEQALDCFNNERTLYPESATFVNLCIAQFVVTPATETEQVETEKTETILETAPEAVEVQQFEAEKKEVLEEVLEEANTEAILEGETNG